MDGQTEGWIDRIIDVAEFIESSGKDGRSKCQDF